MSRHVSSVCNDASCFSLQGLLLVRLLSGTKGHPPIFRSHVQGSHGFHCCLLGLGQQRQRRPCERRLGRGLGGLGRKPQRAWVAMAAPSPRGLRHFFACSGRCISKKEAFELIGMKFFGWSGMRRGHSSRQTGRFVLQRPACHLPPAPPFSSRARRDLCVSF